MSKKIFGYALIALGLYYLADTYYHFDIDFSYIFKFWPVILIFFGFKEIVKKNNAWGIILIFFGLYFLLPVLGIHLNIRKYLFPVILILLGISIVFSKSGKKMTFHDGKRELYYSTVFSGKDITIDSNDVERIVFDITFGGIDIHFKNMTLTKNLNIVINSAFGGVDLRLPKGYKVVVNSDSVFSSVENRYNDNTDSNITIFVNNHSKFTGVKIR